MTEDQEVALRRYFAKEAAECYEILENQADLTKIQIAQSKLAFIKEAHGRVVGILLGTEEPPPTQLELPYDTSRVQEL